MDKSLETGFMACNVDYYNNYYRNRVCDKNKIHQKPANSISAPVRNNTYKGHSTQISKMQTKLC